MLIQIFLLKKPPYPEVGSFVPFQAILIEEDGSTSMRELIEEQLPAGEVLIAVSHTTLNYKDALCMQPDNPLVHNYPHVPGIDFVGKVLKSEDSRYRIDDQVILTGWGVGERHWGGFSERARVRGDWLVPLPPGLSPRHAMGIGTAGLAAMLAVSTLEEHGLHSANGEVLVTGATGGVGSIATLLLSALGYQVAAVTGKRKSADYLAGLGASRILAREELTSPSSKPLESAIWAGCVDSVGGPGLARILSQLKYAAPAAAVGLAGGAELPTSVIPFLLRGIKLLGIDSVLQPFERRVAAWQRLTSLLPLDKLEKLIVEAKLADLPELGQELLTGSRQGRVIVEVAKD